MIKKIGLPALVVALLFVGLIHAQDPGDKNDYLSSPGEKTLREFTVHDFEGGDLTNRLGGSSGSWNLNEADINNSYCDEAIVEIPGKDGKSTHVLQLTYSVESELPSQNGFWTKLPGVDGARAVSLFSYDDPGAQYSITVGAGRLKFAYGQDGIPATLGDPLLGIEFLGEGTLKETDERGRTAQIRNPSSDIAAKFFYDDKAQEYRIEGGATVASVSYGADAQAGTADDVLLGIGLLKQQETDRIEREFDADKRVKKVVNRSRLPGFDARPYDHIEFDVKGDEAKGFTDRFLIELKKCKGKVCVGDSTVDEEIKGSYEVRVSENWETVSIPLNRITGIIDFTDPAAWKDPHGALKDLDELVFVFHDRHVSQKSGVIYLDNIRFVNTGNPGPTAVDFPPREKEKTPTPLYGLEFARFLIQRLGGYPQTVVVKKPFPEDPRDFLREVAKDTWRYFDEAVDREHGLPLDKIELAKEGNEALGEGTMIGDYTNVTDIGVYLLCVVSGYDLGFISKEEAVSRIQRTLSTVNKLEYHASGFPYNYYDTTTLERTSYFVSVVDSGWLLAALYVVKNAFPEELGEDAEALLNRGNLIFFYNVKERQFYHGFYDHLQVYSDYNYGSFYTEPRVTSYMAIARGEVPEEHWFTGLIRTFPASYRWQNQEPIERETPKTTLGYSYYGGYYDWKGIRYVPSWGGSAFEALMPALVLKEKELAPEGLGLNDLNHVLGQIHYALDELQQPVWGMSPCSVPGGGYSEYGAKPFGSKGYKAGVVTPHASVLALEFAPEEVVKNLRKLIELYDIYGEYGFYDAVDVKTGLVARSYLALDQGMILIAINNYLNSGIIRSRFHADPEMQKAERLLSSEKFFEPVIPASDEVLQGA